MLLLSQTANAVAQARPAWVQQAWSNHPSLYVRPYAIALSGADKVYVTGHADYQLVTFGDTTLTLDPDSTFAFTVGYTASGIRRWARAGNFLSELHGFGSAVAGFALTTDTAGNIYTSEGYIYLMDSDMLTEGGISINKYNPSGESLWMVTVGEPKQHPEDWPGFVKGLGVDGRGNTYVAGEFRDTLVLGSDTLISAPFFTDGSPSVDAFLASFDPEGRLRWTEHISSTRTEWLAELNPNGSFTVDPSGNVYVGGSFGEGAVFGPGQPGETILPRNAVAVAKYDAEGQVQWVRTDGPEGGLGLEDDYRAVILERLALDGQGNLSAAWHMIDRLDQTSVTVGDTTFTDPDHGGTFLTSYDSEGNLRWARQLKSDGNEYVSGLTTDIHGNVYVAGSFDGLNLQLEGTMLRKQDLQADEEDGFVAMYTSEGDLVWTSHAEGRETQRINGVAVDASGNVYVTGEFEGNLRLEAEELMARGWFDMFVAKYDATTILDHETRTELTIRTELAQNYPNPFNLSTTIQYTLSQASFVHLTVHDVLGRTVATLFSGYCTPGTRTITFEGKNLSSGFYFYTLETDVHRLTRSMFLLK